MTDLFLTSSQYDRLLDGAWITVQLLARAFAFGVVLALIMGIARLSHRRWIRGVALVYVEFFRGISTVVLLFIFAFSIPILLDLDQRNLMWLASIALGLNMGGYGAEIVRGAIQSVPAGQTDASIALNLTNTQRLRRVVLPQAMRVILPPMGNLTIEILKGTSLVSLIGMSDLAQESSFLRRNMNRLLLEGRPDYDPDSYRSLPVLFLNTLMIYFILAQIINALVRLAEWYFERKFRSRKEPRVTGAPAVLEPAFEAGAS
jgi:polar amino acid transport system permease protein